MESSVGFRQQLASSAPSSWQWRARYRLLRLVSSSSTLDENDGRWAGGQLRGAMTSKVS